MKNSAARFPLQLFAIRWAWLRMLAVLVAVFIMASCAPVVEVRGNMPDPKDVEQLQVGQTSQAQVEALFGTPSTRGTFDEDIWLYIGRRTEKIAFFRPEVTEQKVLLVEFDEEGLVRDYLTLTRDEMREVDLEGDQTPTAGEDPTVLQQLFGNIGRFQGGGGDRR